MLTNATDPTLLQPLPSHTLQKRWQWTQYGGSIPTPPGQFIVTDTVAVLNKLELIQEGAVARYGPGGFRWLSTVGDLSVMYDEIDPALACGKAEEAISHLPEWTVREAICLMVEHCHVLSWWSGSMGKRQ